MTGKCKDIDRLLIEYHEDSLDPVERKKVHEHLAECASCRRKLQEIEHVYGLLAKDSMPLPQEGFWVDFLPQVRSRIEGREKPRWVVFPRIKWSVGLVSTLLLVLIGSLLLTTDRPTMVERETEPMEDVALALSDPYTYTDQLAEVLLSQEDSYLPVEVLLSNDAVKDLDLAERVLEEDYIRETDLNSILSELSLEELRQLEADLKASDISDIL
jgi:hypothetical protein